MPWPQDNEPARPRKLEPMEQSGSHAWVGCLIVTFWIVIFVGACVYGAIVVFGS